MYLIGLRVRKTGSGGGGSVLFLKSCDIHVLYIGVSSQLNIFFGKAKMLTNSLFL